ncbi:MAG: GAF domain-containing protein, partial [Dehalococcoidia bacterium]|nr:GAF domain-containing protein [Dehalococcoidia bacterium]
MSDEEQRAIGAADPDGSESRVVAGPGRAAREPEQIDDLFRRLASSVRGVIHADRVVVDLVDPITGDLRREYASEMDEGSPRSASDPGGCSAIEEEVRATGTPAKLDDGEDTADPLPSSAEPDKSEFRSGIYAPVRVDGAVIGVLGAEVNEPRAYTTSNLDLLEQIANLAAVSVANAQSQGWSERETAEDILIAEIGRKARSTLDLDDAVDHIFEGLKDIFPVERVSISLNSGSTGVPDVVYAAGAPMAFAPGFSTGIPSTDGLISLVALSGGSKLVEDVTEVLDDAPGARRVTEAGFKSIILVPLSSDEEVIGVLALFSKRAHAHTAHDLDLVERLAIHLTEPIVNAQIHASTERRAQNEALLAEIGRVATSVPDIDSVLEKITDLLSTVTTFDCMSLSTVDPDRQSMTVRFIFGDTMPGYEEGIERPVNGSYAEDILKDQSAVVMTGEELDSLDTWFPDLGDFIRRNGFQSCMIVPIFHIETPAGLLTVHSRAPDSYSQGEKDLAERISDQISGAFANAAMRSELTSRAREEAVFAEIGRVLNTTDSFETAFDLVSTQIARVVPFDRFSAAEINPERRTFTALRHSGSDVGEWKSGPARKLEGTVAELVFESGETQVIGQADPTEIIERYPAMIAFVEAGFRSSLNVPIRIDARTAGILYFASRTPVQYSEHHANLARRCADQIAGVLAKADLTERIERQARVEARLAEVGRAVGDTLELDDLWPNFVGPVRELFDYNRLAVTLYEDDSIERTTAFVDGMSIAGSVPGDFHPYDEPAAALMRAHTSFIASDAASDARDADLLGPECVVAGFRSMIASPVIFNRNLVGSICLKSIRIEGYSERDRELLDRVAELIAGAVANARLHREVMIRAEEERVFSDIGRLVSASLDFGGAFDELAELVKRLIPYDRFVIMGVDVDAQLLWTHYVSGTDVPGWGPGSSRSFSGWGPGRLPAPSEGVISDTDAGADPGDDSAMWAGLPALMSLPLVWEGRTIGNLSVRSTEAGRFNQHHLDLLRRVGQQIVGAFVNAELHAVTVREAGERSALAEIGRLVTSSLDGHEMLAAIA